MSSKSTHISCLSDEVDCQKAIASVREVFFRTSPYGRSLKGADREEFFFNWAGWYMHNCPEQTLLIRDAREKIIGYLVGFFDSASGEELFKRIFYYKEFARWYVEYPSHFHINCHPDYQRLGHGAALVHKFGHDAKVSGVRGLHIVTGSKARNRGFYERLEFRQLDQKMVDGRSLVLLGKHL